MEADGKPDRTYYPFESIQLRWPGGVGSRAGEAPLTGIVRALTAIRSVFGRARVRSLHSSSDLIHDQTLWFLANRHLRQRVGMSALPADMTLIRARVAEFKESQRRDLLDMCLVAEADADAAGLSDLVNPNSGECGQMPSKVSWERARTLHLLKQSACGSP